MVSNEELDAMEITKNTCKVCGKGIRQEEVKIYKGFCKNCYNERFDVEPQKQEYYRNTTSPKQEYYRNTNKIAAKFTLVSNILKCLGYGGAVLLTLILLEEGETLQALLAGGVSAIATWFACLTWEAISEIIQLLEDIKNK